MRSELPAAASMTCSTARTGRKTSARAGSRARHAAAGRERWQIDLAASILVGDAEADMLAAQNAGCRSLLVLTGRGAEQLALMHAAGRDGCAVVDNLPAAVDRIIAMRLIRGL